MVHTTPEPQTAKAPKYKLKGRHIRILLGGSWVVISRVISRVAILITHIRGLLTPLITTHEPPSVAQ